MNFIYLFAIKIHNRNIPKFIIEFPTHPKTVIQKPVHYWVNKAICHGKPMSTKVECQKHLLVVDEYGFGDHHTEYQIKVQR